MFYEVVEIKFDSHSKPDQIEKVVGRFKNHLRASIFAREFFKNNKPKNFKTIIERDYYEECSFIAEESRHDKRICQYMVEVRGVELDD